MISQVIGNSALNSFFRLLDAALKRIELDWDPIKVEEVAQHCNDRKLAAKAVSDKSAEMFLSLFVRQSGPILVEGVVIQVMDHSMDCVLSNMGITKRVYVNRNDEIASFEYLKHEGSLTLLLKWKEDGTMDQKLQVFSTVQLSLEAHEKSHFEFNARLLKPNSMS